MRAGDALLLQCSKRGTESEVTNVGGPARGCGLTPCQQKEMGAREVECHNHSHVMVFACARAHAPPRVLLADCDVGPAV